MSKVLPPIGGGQVTPTQITEQADIGEEIAVVIQGDGPSGVFVGILTAVGADFIRLVLTQAAGPLPAGTVLTVLTGQIAAFGRIPA